MVGLIGKNAAIYKGSEAILFASEGSLGSLRIKTQELALGCFALLVACFCPTPLALLISAAGLYIMYSGSKLYKAGLAYTAQAKAELIGNELFQKGVQKGAETVQNIFG